VLVDGDRPSSFIAQQLGRKSSSVARALRSLERRGLVETTSTGKTRYRIFTLTDKARSNLTREKLSPRIEQIDILPVEEAIGTLAATQFSLSSQLAITAESINGFLREVFKASRANSIEGAVRLILDAGGKRIRPYLVLESCQAVGGNAMNALPVAAASELLHTSTLIHDDIIDENEWRRGVRTVHAKWGVPTALLAGDFAFSKAIEVLCGGYKEIEDSKALRVANIFAHAMSDMAEGQILDAAMGNIEREPEEYEYFLIAKLKVSSLFRACASAGAIVGGGSDQEVKALANYGENLGIAFKVIDDCLWLEADERLLGKPVGYDIMEGKKTLPIIHALKFLPQEERQILLNMLGNKRAATDEIRRAISVIMGARSIEYSRKKAMRYGKKAIESLDKLPETPSRENLKFLLALVFGRVF